MAATTAAHHTEYEDKSEAGSVSAPDMLDFDGIDYSTFCQVLEMDDDEEDREFSRSIVSGFFEQARETFVNMEKALDASNLDDLSGLGHFLKGSSATLGLVKVRDSCEKIQNFGKQEDEHGEVVDDKELCLERIKEELKELKEKFGEAETALNKFYDM